MNKLILILVFFRNFCSVGDAHRVDVCQNDICKRITCSKGSSIFIRSAKYGRFKDSTCYKEPIDVCSIDASSVINRLCSGNDTCEIPISPKDLASKWKSTVDKCQWTEKSISLAAKYTCEKYYQTDEMCSNIPLVIKHLSGYLLSSYTFKSNKGSSQCPWVFELDKFNSLKLSLFNFKPSPLISNTCNKLMEIKTSDYNGIICSNEIEKHFEKTGKKITVTFFKNIEVNFALHFEVIPCPDFNIPEYVKKLNSNTTEHRLQCIKDPHIQLLIKCSNGSWTKLSKKNCTYDETPNISLSAQNSTSQAGQTFMIVLVIMIALIISTIIIFFGCYCLRMNSSKHELEASRMDIASIHPMSKYSSENILDSPYQYNPNTPVYNHSLYSMSIKDPYYLANRDYATTLQMRKLAGQYHGMVSCCPTHGPYSGLVNTVDRQYKTLHMPQQQRHVSPSNHPQFPYQPSNILSLTPSGDPFYHELDLFSNLPSPTLNPTSAQIVAELIPEEHDIQTSIST